MSISVSGTGKLSGSTPSYAPIGWGTSAAVHVAAALVVWATCSALDPFERPELPGKRDRVELTAAWIELEPPRPAVEIAPVQPQVLVTPDLVRIAQRTYSPGSTDVSQPTKAELAFSHYLMSQPAAAAIRRSAVARPDESPAAAAPSPPPVARVAQMVAIPSVKAEVSLPAARPRAVGHRDLTLPRLLDNRPPTYPAQAVLARQQGTVLLRLHISAEGRVARLELLSGSGHAVLDAAAVRAVRTWRFAPARRRGRPVAATVRLPVRFALD